MPPPPPQPPPGQPPPHQHLFKKATSLADVILSALSFLVLVSNASPRTTRCFKFPKMSLPSPRNPRTTFATPQCLADWLKPRLAADSFGSWGVKPGTKNVHNLWLEIAEGESSLDELSDPPVRTVEVVVVRIIRSDDGKVLVESHQQLSDGAVRYRNRPLSEKMKPGEAIEAAVYRAIKEELGSLVKNESLGDDIVRIVPGSYVRKVEERNSASYPGLPARYVLHIVDAEINGLPKEEFSTEEANEYSDLEDENGLVDRAVSCKKHYWKWIDDRDHVA